MDEQTIIATVDAMAEAGTLTREYLAGALAQLRGLSNPSPTAQQKMGDWQFILDNNVPLTGAPAPGLLQNPLVLGLGALLLFRFLKR